MKKEKDNDNDLFLLSLKGTRPIKKTDKITRPIPKQQKHITKKTEIEHTTALEKKPHPKLKTRSEHKIEINKNNKKLRKGKIPIDKKIDLHGLSLMSAKDVFEQTILECFKKNLRCLLFITGKGLKTEAGQGLSDARLYHGKIRNDFVGWTEDARHSKIILNVQQASAQYGGDGAFFVYLRKKKINF